MSDEPRDQLLDRQPGELGSWVTLPDGTLGQVWALIVGSGSTVWVADGTTYRVASREDLAPPDDPADQLDLFGGDQ